MGIRNLCSTLRFFSPPQPSLSPSTFLPLTTSFSMFFTRFHSQNSSPPCSPGHPFLPSSTMHPDVDDGPSRFAPGSQLHSPCTRRYFCSHPRPSYRREHYANSELVSEITALAREGVNDLGSRLDMMNLSLSAASVVEVLRVLAGERVSALRFFDWLRDSHPELCCDPEIGGLVVNNCGLLGNYEAMVPVLNEFNLKGVPLRRNAFVFLLVLGLDKASTVKCLRKMVDVLNEVGGVCQSSGFRSLIEMFGDSGLFDMAEFVIGAAGRKVNQYNILIRIMCKRGDYERAGDLVKEMKRRGCDPNKTSYNLLISSLCKNGRFTEAFRMLETMEKECGIPDASTFDIIINILCKHCRFDLVPEFLDKMTLKGIEPCISTHAAVIKSYCASGKYEEAHKYVVDTVVKQSCSSNANYSLLASLHLKTDNVLLAQKILYEMMNKGLKPNFSVYVKIRKRLQKENEGDLSLELLRRYSNLIEK